MDWAKFDKYLKEAAVAFNELHRGHLVVAEHLKQIRDGESAVVLASNLTGKSNVCLSGPFSAQVQEVLENYNADLMVKGFAILKDLLAKLQEDLS